MLEDNNYVLKQQLLKETNHQYNLRQRSHNLCISIKTDDRNFVIRKIFKDVYWLYRIF